MRAILLTLAVCLPLLADAADDPLPKITDRYTVVSSHTVQGKTFADLVARTSVRLIALTKDQGINAPFTATYKPQFDAPLLFRELWSSRSPAQEWGMLASESVLAEFTVITDEGRLFIVEVLHDTLHQVPVSGVLLRGDGFGCRFPVSSTYTATSTSTH